MKSLLILTFLCYSSATSASIVIDNFSGGGSTPSGLGGGTLGPTNLSPTNGSVSGQRTVVASGLGSGQVQIFNGLSVSAFSGLSGVPVSPDVTFTYNFTQAQDLSTSLVLDMFETVQNSWDLAITYLSSTLGNETLGAVTMGSVVTPAYTINTSGTIITVDGANFTNSSSVNGIELVFSSQGLGTRSFATTSGSITGFGATAVPEPTTLAFLGLSAIGGLGGLIFRRRQSSEVPA